MKTESVLSDRAVLSEDLQAAPPKSTLDRAVAACVALLDEKEEARAYQASNDAKGTTDELDRLRHWLARLRAELGAAT